MRNVTSPWLAASLVPLSGNRMSAKRHSSTRPGFIETENGCDATPWWKVVRSSAAGMVSVTTTVKAVSVPVFWKRMR